MRQSAVIATLCLALMAGFPNGCYGMPELCAKLKAVTGTEHRVDAGLRDYPVFVWTKSGEPEKVKGLVASALRGVWVKDGEGSKLVPAKFDSAAGEAEFARQFKLSCRDEPQFLGLPVKDLYRMPAGSMLRFGTQGGLYRSFTPDYRKKLSSQQGTWYVVVNRQAEGMFAFKVMLPDLQCGAFDPNGEISFNSLPPSVESELQPDLQKQVLSSDEQAAIQQSVQNPQAMGIDWTNIDGRDPMATISQKVLTSLGKTLGRDMALALPDMGLFVLGRGGAGSATVQSVLTPFTQVEDLSMEDGAVIGKTPMCDHFGAAQTKRAVLSEFLKKTRADGIANVQTVSEYVHAQNRSASESWADAMFLVMSGTVIDQEYIGDYPYNMRLYAACTANDWALLRGGQPFQASRLSAPALDALRDLLLCTRSRLERQKPDPGLWRSILPGDLQIQVALQDEEVLIGWTGFAAEVDTVASAAANHEMRRRSMKKDPLYQPARRQKFELTITSVLDDQSVQTGFTHVTADTSVQPATWDKLPAAIAAEFKRILDMPRTNEQHGVPPPK